MEKLSFAKLVGIIVAIMLVTAVWQTVQITELRAQVARQCGEAREIAAERSFIIYGLEGGASYGAPPFR